MTARIILAALLIAIGVSGWIFWPRIARLLDGPSPTQDDEPDDREAGKSVKHEGATEEFGDKLRALRNAPVAPELISDTEMDLAWGLAWHEFERAMQAEIDKAFAPFIAAAPVADDFDELREQTCPKELTAS